MQTQVERLLESLTSDLTDKQHKAQLKKQLAAGEVRESAVSIISVCETIKSGYIATSTVHIRAKMIVNLLTHIQLEDELQAILRKTTVTGEDIWRIEQLNKMVDDFITIQ